MTLDGLSEKLNTLQGQLNVFARASMEERSDEILELQKEQLFAGKASDGENIRPYYSEDLKANGGFFKTPQSAQRYADWKASLSYPYSVQRNLDAPNLYINGRFHSELGLEFTDEYMRVKGDTAYAEGIIAKYGEQTFGLSEESMAKIEEELNESITNKIREWIES